jgi:hypothetical protein
MTTKGQEENAMACGNLAPISRNALYHSRPHGSQPTLDNEMPILRFAASILQMAAKLIMKYGLFRGFPATERREARGLGLFRSIAIMPSGNRH